jgi:hypothetical protein
MRDAKAFGGLSFSPRNPVRLFSPIYLTPFMRVLLVVGRDANDQTLL